MKLNLGSGTQKLEGYINVDTNPYYEPDVTFDITKTWPYPNDSIDEVLVRNVIEHLDVSVVEIINEARRVLRPNGKLVLICPNCFHWKTRLRYLTGRFTPDSGYHYDHRWLYKPSFIRDILVYKGFDPSKVSDLFDREVNIVSRKRM